MRTSLGRAESPMLQEQEPDKKPEVDICQKRPTWDKQIYKRAGVGKTRQRNHKNPTCRVRYREPHRDERRDRNEYCED